MKKLYLNLFRLNWVGLFTLYFLVSFLFNFFNDEFVQTDELYYQHMEQRYDEKYDGYEEFEEDLDDLEFLDEPEDVSLEDLLFDFVFLLIQAIITIPLLAMIFSSGYFLVNDLAHIRYSFVFKAVLVSSFIFLLELCIRSLYFTLIDTDYSFSEVASFKPFHIISLFDKDQFASWIIPFLNLVNLYELIFLLSVSYWISYLYRRSMTRIFAVTTITYLITNVIWQLFLLYLISML